MRCRHIYSLFNAFELITTASRCWRPVFRKAKQIHRSKHFCASYEAELRLQTLVCVFPSTATHLDRSTPACSPVLRKRSRSSTPQLSPEADSSMVEKYSLDQTSERSPNTPEPQQTTQHQRTYSQSVHPPNVSTKGGGKNSKVSRGYLSRGLTYILFDNMLKLSKSSCHGCTTNNLHTEKKKNCSCHCKNLNKCLMLLFHEDVDTYALRTVFLSVSFSINFFLFCFPLCHGCPTPFSALTTEESELVQCESNCFIKQLYDFFLNSQEKSADLQLWWCLISLQYSPSTQNMWAGHEYEHFLHVVAARGRYFCEGAGLKPCQWMNMDT